MNPLRGHHIRWSAMAGCRALAGARPLAWLVIPAAQSAPSDPSNAQGVSIQTGGAGDGESFIADSYYSGARSGQSPADLSAGDKHSGPRPGAGPGTGGTISRTLGNRDRLGRTENTPARIQDCPAQQDTRPGTPGILRTDDDAFCHRSE